MDIKNNRQSIRLDNYDYSMNGWYFVTIDVRDKLRLFWEGNNKNEIGIMMEKLILEIPNFYNGILVDTYVVMPDHIHMIIQIVQIVGADSYICPCLVSNNADGLIDSNVSNNADGLIDSNEGRKWDSARTLTANISLSEIVQRFKILSTNRYIKGVKEYNWPRFQKRLWQRNFYERIIRNESERQRIREYIFNNPTKWQKKFLDG